MFCVVVRRSICEQPIVTQSSCSFQVTQVALRHAMVHKWYGKALKIVLKQMEDKPNKDHDKKLIEVRKRVQIWCERACDICLGVQSE